MNLTEEEDELDGACITEIAKHASEKAVRETFAQGRPVTTVRYGNVIKLYPDGHAEFVKKLDYSYKTTSRNRKYQL